MRVDGCHVGETKENFWWREGLKKLEDEDGESK